MSANGILDALEFLKSISLGEKPQIGKRIAVIGGGFSAIDAARSCRRLGAETIYLLYRRTRNEMPSSPEEIDEAEEEGIKIMYLVSPKEILTKNGQVDAIRLVNHVLGVEDASKRRKPIEVKGTEFTLKVDTIISAVGQKVEENLDSELTQISRDGIVQNKSLSGHTAIKDVFVAGDASIGASNIISAIASGRRVAIAVDRSIAGNNTLLKPIKSPSQVNKFEVLERNSTIKRITSIKSRKKNPLSRIKNFKPYQYILTKNEAVAEATRCLNCGCGEGCLICVELCNAFAIHAIEGKPVVDHKECVGCGICVWRCPHDNLEMITTPS
jgi:formate dehydrogenase major subunit